jgi:hypothetical protein
LKKLAELFWRTVYKAIIAVGDKLLVAWIFASDDWNSKLKSFQNGAAHTFAFTGVQHKERFL